MELGREQNWVKPEQPGTLRVATGAHTADEASVAGAGSTNSLCPASGVGMLNKNLAMALGASDGPSRAGWHARLRSWRVQSWDVDLARGEIHGAVGRLCGLARSPWSSQSATALVVLLLDLVGCVLVWLFVLGPKALGCSLAFVVIWVSDWPPRCSTVEERFVRIEELHSADDHLSSTARARLR